MISRKTWFIAFLIILVILVIPELHPVNAACGWSQDIPEKPGYYWLSYVVFSVDGHSKRMYEVVLVRNEKVRFFRGITWPMPEEPPQTWWWKGPLETEPLPIRPDPHS